MFETLFFFTQGLTEFLNSSSMPECNNSSSAWNTYEEFYLKIKRFLTVTTRSRKSKIANAFLSVATSAIGTEIRTVENVDYFLGRFFNWRFFLGKFFNWRFLPPLFALAPNSSFTLGLDQWKRVGSPAWIVHQSYIWRKGVLIWNF